MITWKGERLRARRKQLGLTTAEVAERIGTEHNHITIWEKDKSEPSGKYLILLSTALKMSASAFYEWDE